MRGSIGDAFERLESQIGACGSCAVGKGSLGELSRRFEEVLEGHGVGYRAPLKLDDVAFTVGLATIRGIAEWSPKLQARWPFCSLSLDDQDPGR